MNYSLCHWQKPNKQKRLILQTRHSFTPITCWNYLRVARQSLIYTRENPQLLQTASVLLFINALQLLAQQRFSHPFLIQLCCHLLFPSCPAAYLAPRPLPPRPCPRLRPTATPGATSVETSIQQAANDSSANTASQHWRISAEIIWKQPNLKHPHVNFLISMHTCYQSSCEDF